MILNEAQKADFLEQGIICLKGLFSKTLLIAAQKQLNTELERLKIKVAGKWHLRQFDNIPTFQVAGSISQKIHPHPAFDQLISPNLVTCMEDLANTKLNPAQVHPSILITPPQNQPWSIPHQGWHLDIAHQPKAIIPGIQAFILLDDLSPKGGATMALAGSHRLGKQSTTQTKNPLRLLQNDPKFSALFDENAKDREQFFKKIPFKDTILSVVEMSGKAGDVFIMDMRLLHAPSTNSTKKPRMMLTQRLIISNL